MAGAAGAVTPVEPVAGAAASDQAKVAGPWKIVNKTVDAPAWTIKYGQEFWRDARPDTRRTQDDRSQGAAPSNLNLADAIDRVSHAVRMEASMPHPQIQARDYQVSLDGHGLRFSPHLPSENIVDLVADPSAPGAAPGDLSVPYRATADPTTELQFRTLLVRQGDQVLYEPGQRASDWSLLGNTAQAMLNEQIGLIEHYEARDEGVDVTWVVSRPPEGAGPLRIEAELAGLTYAGQSGKGAHFADAQGNARVRVGKVTAVDANHRRTRLPVEVQESRMVIDVPAFLLARASYPLAIDPTVSPEFGVDQPIVGPAPMDQGRPVTVSWGTEFFVVWDDSRSLPDATGPRFYGTRVTAEGAVLDPIGVLVHAGTTSTSCDMASDGASCMLVACEDQQVVARRITMDADDQVIVSSLIVIGGGWPKRVSEAQIAFNGVRYLVAWYYSEEPYRLVGRLLNVDGSLFGTTEFPIGGLQGTPGSFDLASAGQGGNVLVVRADKRNAEASLNIYGSPQNVDIYGRLVTADGTVVGTEDIPIWIGSSIQKNPRVGASDNGYLVVWEDRQYLTWDNFYNYGSSREHIYGIRLDTEAQRVDTQAFAICDEGYAQFGCAVASDGDDYIAMWTDVINSYPSQTHIAGALVANGQDGSAVVTPLASGDLSWSTTTPVLACNGSSYLLAWGDRRDASQWDVYAARLSLTGTILDPGGLLLAMATTQPQSSATVGGNGSGFLVAWLDRVSSGSPRLMGTRVGKHGELLDPDGITIASQASAPIVAGAGNGYLVCWQFRVYSGNNYNDVLLGSWINNEGVLTHPGGSPLLANPQNTAGIGLAHLASDGRSFLAVCNVPSPSDVYGMWIDVDADQELHASSPFAISAGPHGESAGAAASNGDGYLVVWTDDRSTYGPNENQHYTDIYGKVVTRGGDGGVSLSLEFPICQGYCSQHAPEVAGNGTDYLVAWMDYRDMQSGTRIWAFPELYVARVSGSGVVWDPDGFWVCEGAQCQTYPVVASNGEDYLVVWHDYSPSIGGFYYDWGITGDAYGSRVTASGEVPDAPLGFLINQHNDRPHDWPEDIHLQHSYPQVASDGDGFLVTVTRLDETGVGRVRANLVSLNRLPVADAGADQSVRRGDQVSLNGSGSSDPDGSYPLTYAWQIVSMPAGSAVALTDAASVTPGLVPDVLGDYVVSLIVLDSLGQASEADTVVISTVNTAPVADAGPDQALLVLQTPVQLDGTRSYDDDGDSLTYEWVLVQKPAGSTAVLDDEVSGTPTFVADVYGDYVVSLTVIDAFGDISQPDAVTVTFANVKPVARAGGNQAGVVGQTVYVDGSGSSDANGEPLTFLWSVVTAPAGSGCLLSSPTAAQTSFVPDAVGTYVVSLVVHDGLISSDPCNVSIEVISRQDRIAEILIEVMRRINGLPGEALKNDNLKGGLTQQVNVGLAMLEKSSFGALANKLENDVLKRLDGCAKEGAPDPDDYITACDAQALVYPLVVEAIELLESLL